MPDTDLIKSQSVTKDGLYTVEINREALNATDSANEAESLEQAIDRFYQALKHKSGSKNVIGKAKTH